MAGKTCLVFASTLAITGRSVGQSAECISRTDNDANVYEDISSLSWPKAYRINLDPGDECWYLANMTSYATWETE